MLSSWLYLWTKIGLRARKRTVRAPDRRARSRPAVEPLEERCLLDGGFRAIDGSGNNLAHPDWGRTDTQLLRRAPAAYGDGVSTPAGADRPGPRVISNALAAHPAEAILSNRNLSGFIYAFGQFLDHDLDLTTAASPAEPFNIPVPAGDPFFDPDGTGTQSIALNRSVFDPATGTDPGNPRQQLNRITTWIDGSMIYGSSAVVAASLRTFQDGKLRTGAGDLPPAVSPESPSFLTGDIRANENIELLSLHALFVREHNRLADAIARATPGLDDEEIYQRARAFVGAEMQVIVYKEWLPALLGPNALRPYRGYDDTVNPGIANEFSAAVFRLGHSLLDSEVKFIGNDGLPVRPAVQLRDAFNNPNLLRAAGIDSILKYLASTTAEELDNKVVDDLRNFLFGQPGAGGRDLAALNIQRGRDHGLAGYNQTRVAYGLRPVHSFVQITSNREVRQALRELYGSVNDIDLWVGALAEDHVPGSSTGPLIRRVVAEQFERLRDGDSFWYQRAFSGAQLAELERTTLADIIRRNTTITNVQENVFVFRAEVRGRVFLDRDGDGERDRGEIGLPGVAVQLLNDESDVIATARTGFDGRYRFDAMPETGRFRVRVVGPTSLTVTTENPREALVSRGGLVVSGIDFGIRRVGGRVSGFLEQFADVLTALFGSSDRP